MQLDVDVMRRVGDSFPEVQYIEALAARDALLLVHGRSVRGRYPVSRPWLDSNMHADIQAYVFTHILIYTHIH